MITALVTAVGGVGVGEQILKALLLADRYRLVVTDLDDRCPQFALADASETLPRAGDPDYLYELFDVCKRHRVDVLFVGSEAELTVVSEVRDQFSAAGILVAVNRFSTVQICSDKDLTSRFLMAHGFAVPRYLVVSAHSDCDGIDWYPVVVKPFRDSRGSRDCFIAQDRAQLHAVLDYLSSQVTGVMVQEYVGTAESEFTVGVLHDLDGVFLNSIAVHRRLDLQLSVRQCVVNETGREDLGHELVVSSGVTQGTVGPFPEVTHTCEQIAGALDARGPVNIQCRLVDGDVVVFEINPRFSGTTSVRAMAGYNEPDVLIRRHLLGEVIPERFPYRPATVLRSLREWVVPPRAESPCLRPLHRATRSRPVELVPPVRGGRPGDGPTPIQDPSPGA